MMGVAEAAEELGVSQRRVRQMLAGGDLHGERIGRAWVVDRNAVAQAVENRPEVGRPWRPEAAWAFLAFVEGRAVDLSSVDRARIARRVRGGVAANRQRLRVRAQQRRFYAHPSVLEQILRHPGIVRSGISAAGEYPIDLVAQQVAEGYVRASKVADLSGEFLLDDSSDRPNVILRVVDDVVWPFEVGQTVASLAIVAIDLLDAGDERSRRAGLDLLESL